RTVTPHFPITTIFRSAEMQNEVYSEQAVKEVEHFEELVGDKGGITELDENDSHLMDAANKVWKNWIEEANDKGYPGDEMAKTLIELSEEEGYEVPIQID